MPRTKKTSATRGTTSRRGTAAKKSAGATSRCTPAAKRKTAVKTTALRTKSGTGSRRGAGKKTAARGSGLFKFKLLATVLVCVGIVAAAVLGTVFYDRLVPVKEPVAVKSGSQTTVQTPLPPAVVTPGKTPTKDKPASITVTDPVQTPLGETEKPVGKKPVPVVPDKPATTIIPTDPAETLPKASDKPKIALIFDDMGHDQQAAKKLQALKIPLTFSILPYTMHAQAIAQNAPKHIEIMVHVPMEAINGDSDSEQGLLKVDMTEAELAQSLRNSIGRIPNARGINNHTGSKLTQQLVPMQVVMLVLKEKNMFFIDSKTSDKSVANSTAAMLLVPTAERNFFLDHVADAATIKAQLYKAVNYAKKYGYAVVIGHPRPLTMEVVLKELPKLTQEIEFVPASALVK